MTKTIRNKVVKESLLDYETLTNSLRENTESAVKSLLDEAVRDTYAKLLSEDDNKDYDEEEVEDTDSDASNDAEEISDAAVDDAADDIESGETADADTSMDADEERELDSEDNALEDAEGSLDADADGGEEWAEFDKYKTSDGAYDFSDAKDEDIVKVYKLMKNDDQIMVRKDDDGKVNITDNETGAEYLLDMGSGDASVEDETILNDEDDFGAEENDLDDMNESTENLFELVMEYNSNVGYTDNYQKKDVMTNPGMSEPGKNVNDWDAGVPKGTEKPWSKKNKKADKPFDGAKGKQIEEEDVPEVDGGEAPVIESAAECGGRMGAHGRMMGTKSHKPNSGKKNSPMNQHHTSVVGEYEETPSSVDESIKKRINKALKENKELRSTLNEVMSSLKNAAVTNHNLAQIIKLISENSTTQEEKREIISRFNSEAKTIEESKRLYGSISNELKKSNKMNITENKTMTVNGSQKINETPIYKSQDLNESLDLMHRMMK